MVSASEALSSIISKLKSADIQDAALEARWLFRFVCKKDAFSVDKTDQISEADAQKLARLTQKRAKHYPLQYILGEWEFMGEVLKIGEGVLIPRADTETVVEKAAELLLNTNCPNILDLCAGSGAISIGLKKLLPNANITAVELFEEAFRYLKSNCKDIVSCVNRDVFDYYKEVRDNSVDLIISNPPYIAKDKMAFLQKELSYEPQSALTDMKDGTSFYKFISKTYKSKIKYNGYIVFEIGYDQKDVVSEILLREGYTNICAHKDYCGNYRTITAVKI